MTKFCGAVVLLTFLLSCSPIKGYRVQIQVLLLKNRHIAVCMYILAHQYFHFLNSAIGKPTSSETRGQPLL